MRGLDAIIASDEKVNQVIGFGLLDRLRRNSVARVVEVKATRAFSQPDGSDSGVGFTTLDGCAATLAPAVPVGARGDRPRLALIETGAVVADWDYRWVPPGRASASGRS